MADENADRVFGTSVRRIAPWPLLAVVVAGLTACEGSSGPHADDSSSEPLEGMVVSNSQSVSSNAVYVSLAPGTLPEATTVRIRNEANGAEIEAQVVDGGFDPVSIAGRSGDLLELVFETKSGPVTMVVKVPPRRPPTIVRSSPAKGRTDVALNVSIDIVFSEPVKPATVNASTVRLLRDGVSIDGAVQISGSQLIARFEPAAPLEPETTYELVVTEDVTDLDGDALQASYSATFVTRSIGVTLDARLPPNSWLIAGDTITVTATLTDSRGEVLSGGSVSWSVSNSVANAAGIVTSADRAAKIIVGGDGSFVVAAKYGKRSATLPLNGKAFTRREGFIWSEQGGMVAIPSPLHVVNLEPEAINDAGEVVGGMHVFSNADGSLKEHAFRWSRSNGITDIGAALIPNFESRAMGIDSDERITGLMLDSPGMWRAFTWSRDSGLETLDPQLPVQPFGFSPNEINAATARIAGTQMLDGYRPYRITLPGAVESLEIPSWSNIGEAMAINDAGDVVGYVGMVEDGFGVWRAEASIWDKAGVRTAIVPCVGQGTCYASASAINNRGQVVGLRNVGSPSSNALQLQLFSWSREEGFAILQNPDDLPWFEPADINDSGAVIGNGNSFQAFLRKASGALVGLPRLSGRAVRATAINNAGEVVGHTY